MLFRSGAGSEGGDAHAEFEHLAPEGWPADPHLLFARSTVIGDPPDQVDDVRHGDLAAIDQAESGGARVRAED